MEPVMKTDDFNNDGTVAIAKKGLYGSQYWILWYF